MKNRLKIIAILVVLWGHYAFAEVSGSSFYFNHLTNNDGLSSSHVNCILEDKDGFIWFGTEDGLNLFDGVSFKVFRNIADDSTSLCNNSVYSLVNDPLTNNVWVGTRRGICVFDKSKFEFLQMFGSTSIEKDINEHIIVDLKFDQKNRLWIATSNGLFSFDSANPKTKRFVHDGNDKGSIISNYINHIFVDDNNQLLISTRSGIDLLDAEKMDIEHLFASDSLKDVMQVYKDCFGKYWIGTDNMGVYLASNNNEFQLQRFIVGNSIKLNSSRIHAFIEDQFNNVFLMARDKGLFYFDRKNNSISFIEPDKYDTQSLSSKALISAYKSSSGIIWFGTFNRGINYIDNSRKPFSHYKINYKADGLFNNNVRSFFQDIEGNIWVGTKDGGGLSLFDPQTGLFQNFPYNAGRQNSFSNDYVLVIGELDKDRLIVGTLGTGVDIFNKRTHQVTNLRINDVVADNKIYGIYQDKNNVFWIASLEGLFQFDKKTNHFNQISGVRAVKAFAENSQNGIWMGSRYDGLLYYSDGIFKDFSSLPELEPLSNCEVTSLRFANDTLLWIGTTDGLISFNIQSQKLQSWSIKDGLPGGRVSSIEIDNDGYLWIGTSNGLSRFDPVGNVFKNYTVEDGLQGNDFETYTSLKASDGTLYFGGSNGFNVFEPAQIKDNLLVPQIHFTGFKIANQTVPIQKNNSPLKIHIDQTQHIQLKHTQADFTFEFVALNFTSPENNNYKYKLEGYDNDWIPSGKSHAATYTNIGAGKYVFKVIGSNNDNIWNTEGRQVAITILPPPWKSKWAYMLYLVLIGFMVMGFYFFIVNRIQQQSLLEIERHERDKTEMVNQMKMKFFTNISHEFRTPLTLISSPLSKLLENPNASLNERKYLYATMHKNVVRLLRLLKQLMDFRKLEYSQMQIKVKQGKLADFVFEITKGFEEFTQNKSITILFKSSVNDDDEFQWFDPNVIDSVIFNLLSNSIKFSPENSQINLNLKVENGTAFIDVIDHGVGIPADKIARIFDRFYSDNNGQDAITGTGIGLSFTKNLINLHKGDISVSSIQGEETRFSLHFPVEKNAYDDTELIDGQVAFNKTESVLPDETLYDDDFVAEQQGKQLHLLIVEDNLELRRFLRNHFSNYKISEAGDGLEALKIAQKEIPDVVISDVMMPNMDGVAFCNALKTDFITSHIPVVLLTAKTANEHKIEGIESGADAYIEKPFDLEILGAQVRNLVKQRDRLRKRFANHLDVQPTGMATNVFDQKFFEKAEKIVADNISNLEFSVEEFGAALNMSRSQLFRKFKAIIDGTPSDYIRSERIKAAQKLLLEGEFNVNEISFKTGFNSPSHFISTFKKYTGFTPREYIQNHS